MADEEITRKLDELRHEIQTMEWDIKMNQFHTDKMKYYEECKEEYNKLLEQRKLDAK